MIALHASDGRELDVDSLSVGYGRVVIVRDVTLSVAPGQVVALLGPNGAGKTTLLRGIGGAARVLSGDVRLGGRSLVGRSVHDIARAGLCHIPEGRGIYRSLTVQENLKCFELGSARGRGGFEQVYEIFPVLAERRRQLAGTLSGGEQQMLALARAIVAGLPVLMVDELSMGLAPVVVDQLFEVLRRLNEAGYGVLIVEQFVHRALAIADAVYVLVKGELVFAGEAGEVDDDLLAGLYASDA